MAEQESQNHFNKVTFGVDVTPSSIQQPRGDQPKNERSMLYNQGDVDFLSDFQTSLGAPSLSSFYTVDLDLALGLSNVGDEFGSKSEASLEDWLTSCGVLEPNLGSKRFSILASEAILPGSNMTVVSEVGSRQGITEKFATQRAYNDIAITYYVPADYKTLRLFQEWINFMNPLYYSNGQGVEGTPQQGRSGGYPSAVDRYAYHRFRYPSEYKKTMSITKFEKDIGNKAAALTAREGQAKEFKQEAISYKFINVFPTAVQDIALTYQASSVLQVTVEFAYDRYVIISNQKKQGIKEEVIKPQPAALDDGSGKPGAFAIGSLETDNLNPKYFGKNNANATQTNP